MILTPLQKLPNNVGNLAKKLLPPALNGCPKCKKSPTLVTLPLCKDLCNLQVNCYILICSFDMAHNTVYRNGSLSLYLHKHGVRSKLATEKLSLEWMPKKQLLSTRSSLAYSVDR